MLANSSTKMQVIVGGFFLFFLKKNYTVTHVIHMFSHDNQRRIQLNMTRQLCTELSHGSVHILVDTLHHLILDHTLLEKSNAYLNSKKKRKGVYFII